MIFRLASVILVFSVFYGATSSAANARWFGKEDPRYKPGAYISSPEDQKRYSGIGMIECPTNQFAMAAGDKKPLFAKATAFHLGSFQIMVTNAHAFYEGDALSRFPKNRIDPKKCIALFYDYSGNYLEEVPVERIISRWQDPEFEFDWSQDLAIVVLSRESETPSYHLPFGISNAPVSNLGLKVRVVGHSLDLKDSNVKRVGVGTIMLPPNDFHGRFVFGRGSRPISNQLVFVGDYPTGRGSSGSPIINETGRVIGVHQGSFRSSDVGFQSREFDSVKNYNNGFLFDQRFYNDLNAVFKELSRSK